MQNSLAYRASQRKLLWFFALIGFGGAIASYVVLSATHHPHTVWKYPFQRPVVGSITKNIQQEIAFHQRIIQQQPTAGLERAALAQNYLKMARATGESSWYLLAQQTAQQSLAQLPFHNYGAILVLAKVAAAKHDFTQSLVLLKQLPPQAESLSLLTTNHLAVGDTTAAQQHADTAVRRMPTLSNFALRALVEVCSGTRISPQYRILKRRSPLKNRMRPAVRRGCGLYWGGFITSGDNFSRRRNYMRSALWKFCPKYPPALLNMAELSVRRWQADPTQTQYQQRAIALYDRFFLTNQQAPTIYDHIALRGLARVQRLQGDPTQASQTWGRAVARLRSDLSGFGHRRELAQLLLERGQTEDLAQALTLMQTEIKIRQDPETWDTLAAVYQRKWVS